MIADGVEVLRAKGIGQSRSMLPSQNPLQIRVSRRLKFRQSMTSACENAVGDAALDVLKEARITTQFPHRIPREENAEQPAPTRRVPSHTIITLALLARGWAQQMRDAAA